MAKSTTRAFVDQTTQQVTTGQNHAMDWIRVVAEQSLNLSKVTFEGFLTSASRTTGTIDHQASEIRERSISLAAEALANTYDFALKAVRAGEPQQFLELQGDFLGHQLNILADQTKELGQIMIQSASATQRAATEHMRSAAE
jgi:hypothetical protein